MTASASSSTAAPDGVSRCHSYSSALEATRKHIAASEWKDAFERISHGYSDSPDTDGKQVLFP